MPPPRKRFPSTVNGVLKPVLSPFIHCSSVPLTLLPWKISYNAVNSLLNASDDAERANLVNVWKESKLQELGVVVICSSLVAAAISAAFSWPTIISAPWTVKAFWYSGLFLSLISIGTAAFFSMILLRLSCFPNHSDLKLICNMLGRADGYFPQGEVRWTPRKSQLYVWQLPRMMLTASLFEFATGLCLFIWDLARATGFEWGSDEMKILVALAAIAGFALVNVGIAVCVVFYSTSGEKTL